MRVATVVTLAVLAVAAAAVGGLTLPKAVAEGSGSGSFARETVWKTISLDSDPDEREKVLTTLDLSFEGDTVYGSITYTSGDWPVGFELSGRCGNGRMWLTNSESGVSLVGTISGTSPKRTVRLEGLYISGDARYVTFRFVAREQVLEEK